MSNIFFSADHHFWHTGIIKHCNRPYVTIEEMNEDLIVKWNKVVKRKDEVYYLGDFAFRHHASIRMRLNGRIHLIKGNHDKMSLKCYANLFTSVQDLLYLKRFEPNIMLCHYPMRSWRNATHGTWHLYGHCHGRLSIVEKTLDVGVDNCDYAPIVYDEVKKEIEKDIMSRRG